MNADRTARAAAAEAWAAGPGRQLIGRPAAEAEAAAAAAGLGVKTEPAGGVTTLEFGIGRVRIALDASGIVRTITAG